MTKSAVVGYGPDGSVRDICRVTGKVDGLTDGPEAGFLIATVNADGGSSL